MAIPKKIFFYWCGNNFSYLRYISVLSFKKLNPDWDVTVYTGSVTNSEDRHEGIYQDFYANNAQNYLDSLAQHGIQIQPHTIGINDFDKKCSPVFKSDISRWQILARDGGFYSDTDILFIRPMSSYSAITADIIVCLPPEQGWCLIGFLASTPKNKFYYDVVRTAIKNYNVTIYESMGGKAMLRTIGGNKNYFRTMKQKYNNYKINNLDLSSVYPFKYYELDSMTSPVTKDTIDKTKNSIGIHWFGGCMAGNTLVKKLNNKTIHEHDNIIIYFIKQLGLDVYNPNDNPQY